MPGTARLLLCLLVLGSFLSGCQSTPVSDVSISSESSLLAVDVSFPAPMSRDLSLVQAFFVKGPIHRGLEELPSLIPASFVKWSRAYLLDPEPGTYSLVAVTAAFAPPWNDSPIAGVTKTRYSGTHADAVIFPVELSDRTRTTIALGRVAFMGALQVRQGARIDASASLQDDVQRRIAEQIRPGALSESGLAGWLKRTRMVDLDQTSISREAGDRQSFFENALEDLGVSPWAQVIARAASDEAPAATLRARAPSPPNRERMAPIPAGAVRQPMPQAEPATTGSATMTRQPEVWAPDPEVVPGQPQPPTPAPTVAAREPPPHLERQRFAGLPPDSPLAQIEFGMGHHEVRAILGAPDDRVDRSTAKAWIPFYTGPGAYLRDWIYEGEGRVIFSRHDSSLEVLDVVYDPNQGK